MALNSTWIDDVVGGTQQIRSQSISFLLYVVKLWASNMLQRKVADQTLFWLRIRGHTEGIIAARVLIKGQPAVAQCRHNTVTRRASQKSQSCAHVWGGSCLKRSQFWLHFIVALWIFVPKPTEARRGNWFECTYKCCSILTEKLTTTCLAFSLLKGYEHWHRRSGVLSMSAACQSCTSSLIRFTQAIAAYHAWFMNKP